MLARFFVANRIPMVVNQAKNNIHKMEMDNQQQNAIINIIQSIMEPVDSLLLMYNFNQTCKYWMNSECIYGDKCIFKHDIIKINKKCKYGSDCYYQDKCLYLHPGETLQNHHNKHPKHNHNHNHNHNANNMDHNQNERSQGQWQVKQQPPETSQILNRNTEQKETLDENIETFDENDESKQDIIAAATTTTNEDTITTPAINENANPTHTPSRLAQQQIDKILAKSHKKEKRKRTHTTQKRTKSLTTAESPKPTTQPTKAKLATTKTATHTNVNTNENQNTNHASHTSQPSNAHIKSTVTSKEKTNENEVKTSDCPNYDLPKWLRTKKNKLIMSLVIIAAGEEYRDLILKTDFRLDYYANEFEYRMYKRMISQDGFYPDASNVIRKISEVDMVGRIQDDIIGPARTALRVLVTRMKSTYMKDIAKYGETERIRNGIWNAIVSHYISGQFLEIMEKAINILWEKDGYSAIDAALECTGEYIYRSTAEYNVHPMIIFLANTYQVYPLIHV